MKKFIVSMVLSLATILVVSQVAVSQEEVQNGVWFDIMRTYPSPTIKRDTLEDAKTLVDINRYYKPIWIRDFYSVEVTTLNDGITNTAIGDNDTLTIEQKHNMESADPGSTISVVVNYMPENTLKNNEPKVFDFYFSVDAKNEANYKEGSDRLIDYINEIAISKIDKDLFESNYNLASVKFAIDKNGDVVDAHIFNSSDDAEVDTLLLNAVCSMPKWNPAYYTNGQHTKQEFVLAVGNKESCNINLLYLK